MTILADELEPIIIGLILWGLITFLIVFVEGYGMGSPRVGDTASEAMALVRHHPIGKFVVLPLGTWLFWHWLARPRSWATWSWVDALAVGIGLAWAILESRKGAP